MKYNYSISCFRSLALIVVLVLHIRQSVGVDNIGFPWECAVPFFLIISGFLSGQGDVTNFVEYYKRRGVRILIPYLILFLINIVAYFFKSGNHISLLQLFQGILILPAFDLNGVGMQHCWYLTYLLVCYMITPWLQCVMRIRGGMILVYIIVAVVCMLTGVVPFIGKYSFIWIFLFLTAFYVGKKNKVSGLWHSQIYAIIIGLIVSVACKTISDSVAYFKPFLDLVYYAFISLTIFGAGMLLLNLIPWQNMVRGKIEKLIRSVDHNSYYIYLCHYWFTSMSWLNLFDDGLTAERVILYFALTIVTSIIFGFISERIICKLKNL